MRINCISVLYSVSGQLTRQLSTVKKGPNLLKPRTFAGALVFSQLFAATVALLPAMVPMQADAKPVVQKQLLEAPALSEESINGNSFTVSKVVVHAPAERVWNILTDYENAPKVFPQLRKSEIVQSKGNIKVLKHQVQPTGLGGYQTYNYVVEVTEHAPKSMEWHRISGDFKAVDGFWKLEPINDGHDTSVTYSSFVNGGFFIPQVLIKKQFRVEMPVVLSNLKIESESKNDSISIARRTDSSRLQ
jgi:ribosome-associated toxin RatA of RatAB toxin-antitoxin module